MVESEAAIATPLPGTTRDVLTKPVGIAGVPFLFVDTAGLREDSSDAIEVIGIARARQEAEAADLVLWLGGEGEGPDGCWEVEAQVDGTLRASQERSDAIEADLAVHPERYRMLTGDRPTVDAILAGKSLDEIRVAWEPGLRAFSTVRAPYLLYSR